MGYVFKDDERNLTLTMSWHPDDPAEVGMAITIPKPMIKHIREIGDREMAQIVMISS